MEDVMKALQILFIVLLSVFVAVPAMAYDPIPAGQWWFNFVGEGDNVELLGYLTEEELLGEDFQSALNGSDGSGIQRIWSPVGPDFTISNLEGLVISSFQVDNRVFAGDREPDSRVKFSATSGSKSIVSVRAVQINDPGDDCTPDNNWHFNLCDNEGQPTIPNGSPAGNTYYGPYPVILYHVDWNWTAECNEVCNQVGWNPDWNNPDDPCVICHGYDETISLPVAFDSTLMRSVGDGITVKPSEVTVTWNETGETVSDASHETETWWFHKWDQDANAFKSFGVQTENKSTLYFKGFSSQAPVGPQTYTINVVGHDPVVMTQEIYSNTLMPVVAKYTEGLEFTKIKKNGKSKKKTKDVVVANIVANEIVDDNGDTKLLISWAEPDRAMELVGSNVRLRIWVGNNWFGTPLNTDEPIDTKFIWIDAPLTTGSVVVPADAYQWAKDSIAPFNGGELHIAGMYREQFTGFHNRGYFEGIQIPVQ
jgi:hypothetical protein